MSFARRSECKPFGCVGERVHGGYSDCCDGLREEKGAARVSPPRRANSLASEFRTARLVRIR